MAQQKPPGMPQGKWRELLWTQGLFDHEEAVREINKRWKEPRVCPVCHQNNWAVSPEIVRLWTARLKNAYPCVNMVCHNCGHTMLFNAAILNLLPEGKG
jgi:predicted nucleic-acid-binding Zn-ribbon protein